MRKKETTYSVFEVVPTVITEKAVKLLILDDPEADEDGVWVPKSCIHEQYRDELEVGLMEAIEIADWFMEKQGLV